MISDVDLVDILASLRQGKTLVMGYDIYEKLCGFLDNNMTSIPNPRQVGIHDALLVGKTSAPEIAGYRKSHGLE